MTRDLSAERKVRQFYDDMGWNTAVPGITEDAYLWEDLRSCAVDYVSRCRLKLLRVLPREGNLFLDAGSGPVQYREYQEYSRGFKSRVCVDMSLKALQAARQKIGAKGDYVQASILELPFPDSRFDAVVSLHTIYHIAADQQEAAVRELIRVVSPGCPVVIVYANPDRLAAKMMRRFRRTSTGSVPQPIYYHAHCLEWWTMFQDDCDVAMYGWRSLIAKESRLLLPDNILGRLGFRLISVLEDWLPLLALRWGAYPVIVLTRRRPHARAGEMY